MSVFCPDSGLTASVFRCRRIYFGFVKPQTANVLPFGVFLSGISYEFFFILYILFFDGFSLVIAP